MAGFVVKHHFTASPEAVWAILSDFGRAPAPSIEVRLEAPGNPNNHQVGAVRQLTAGGRSFREKLTAVDPGRFLTYQLLSGAPVRRYYGTIALRPENGGAYVEWKVTHRPRFPYPAFMINRQAKKAVRQVLRSVERSLGRPDEGKPKS